MKHRALLVLPLVLAGCVATPPPGSLGGSWGGRGVSLVLDERRGQLEYDCASGIIDGPLLVAAGRFAAVGTHTPGQGGPERIDQPPPPAFPARYSGSVRGDEMRLSVEVPERGLQLGPFTLRRGAEPMLLRCL